MDCHGKRGKPTDEEQAAAKLTAGERRAAREAIKARVAAEVAEERRRAGITVERAAQRLEMILTPEQAARIAQAREAYDAATDAALEAGPPGKPPRSELRRRRSRLYINADQTPTKRDAVVVREAKATIAAIRAKRQRVTAWIVRPVAASETERQREALHLVDVEQLSLAEGAERMGISKSGFQDLVRRARANSIRPSNPE